jgi:subtilase family serine protease
MPDSLARTGEYTVFGSENCTTPQPDLTLGASDIGWVTEKVSGGDRVTFVATVHNTGTAAASAVKVQFAVDGVEVKTPSIAQIASGAFSRASAVWDAKGRTGDHTVTVTADPANAIAEVAEGNNSASKTFTVKGNKVQ